MAFRLRYLAHDFELPEGPFVIGRSGECQLSLDDPLVSRRHATLNVESDRVVAVDLESRNGVYVNGVRISGDRELCDGDRITIGSQEMLVYGGEELRPYDAYGVEFRRATQTLGAVVLNDMRKIADDPTELTSPTGEGGSKGFQSLKLLTGLADKAFAMGRAEEAERILTTVLIDILSRTRTNIPLEMSQLELAARYAARLAGATTKATWVNYTFELYAVARRPLPGPVIDELYTVVRRVKSLELQPLRSYLDGLREAAASFGPGDRFLLQRIEGLERLVALM